MKKINKTPGPNILTQYFGNNPTGNWNEFRALNNGVAYNELRDAIFNDQGGICAYCETEVSQLEKHKQRVEHYHSKSDRKNKNWALDWDNVIGVCIGGSDANQALHPLPTNLSCDSYKDYLISKNKLPKACEGHFINPLRIITSCCLFSFDKSTGELIPDIEACKKLDDIDNKYTSTIELVRHTIEILNLNCDRLNSQRLEVLISFNKQFTRAKKANDKEWRNKLTAQWLNNPWKSFFSTRRILLAPHSEYYLEEISYNG